MQIRSWHVMVRPGEDSAHNCMAIYKDPYITWCYGILFSHRVITWMAAEASHTSESNGFITVSSGWLTALTQNCTMKENAHQNLVIIRDLCWWLRSECHDKSRNVHTQTYNMHIHLFDIVNVNKRKNYLKPIILIYWCYQFSDLIH